MRLLLYIPPGGRSLPMPSYGLSILASELASHCAITILDRSIDQNSEHEGYEVSLETEATTSVDVKLAVNEAFDFIGLQVHTGNLLQAATFLSMLRTESRRSTIIIGGPSANIVFEYFSALDLADYFVFGDGTGALASLLAGTPPPANVLRRSARPLSNRAIQIPPTGKWRTPDFSALYQRRFDLLPYLTSVGCPFNCGFCTSRRDLVGFEYPHNLHKQLAKFIRRNQPKIIRFNDSTFNGHLPTFRLVLEVLSASEIKTKWGAYIALASLKLADIKPMAESGCAYVYIGIESNISQARAGQNKQFSDKDAIEKITELRRCGILVLVSIIVDLPGSERQSASQISDYVNELTPDATHFFPYEHRPDLTELVSTAAYWRSLLGRTTHRALSPQSSNPYAQWISTLQKVSALKQEFRISGRFISETALVRSLLI